LKYAVVIVLEVPIVVVGDFVLPMLVGPVGGITLHDVARSSSAAATGTVVVAVVAHEVDESLSCIAD
jgi:ABC-type phosphate transport system permease subunit